MIAALQITLIGMGLVFAAIVLLWIVMALLVRFTQSRETYSDVSPIEIIADEQEILHKRAAAAAVAAALDRRADSMTPHPYPIPPTPIVSAWQAVLRTRMLTKRRFRS